MSCWLWGCGDDQNRINPDIMDMNEDWWETPDMTGVVTRGRRQGRVLFFSWWDFHINTGQSQHIICISEVTYSIFSFLQTTSCKDYQTWRYSRGSLVRLVCWSEPRQKIVIIIIIMIMSKTPPWAPWSGQQMTEQVTTELTRGLLRK